MQEYRVELRHGKKRRLYRFECEVCGEDVWSTAYNQRRFCSKECRSKDRRGWPPHDEKTEKYCTKCKRVKLHGEFRANTTRAYGLQNWCKLCEDANKAKWYETNSVEAKKRSRDGKAARHKVLIDFIVSYFADHPCIDCGETDILVLDFDHVRGKKIASISAWLSGKHSLDKIKHEIGKCEVRCSNCHRRRTARMCNSWRWKWTRSSNVERLPEEQGVAGSSPVESTISA